MESILIKLFDAGAVDSGVLLAVAVVLFKLTRTLNKIDTRLEVHDVEIAALVKDEDKADEEQQRNRKKFGRILDAVGKNTGKIETIMKTCEIKHS